MKSGALTDTFHSLKVEVWRYHNKIDVCYTKNIANFGRSFGVWSQDRLTEWGRKKCNVLIEQSHDNVCTYSWIYMWNETRSYFSKFSLPHIYFTFIHSPTFQVMFGDEMVDLTKHYPCLVSFSEWAIHLAQDPVAAADFFEFCVTYLFEHLFGWDYQKKIICTWRYFWSFMCILWNVWIYRL